MSRFPPPSYNKYPSFHRVYTPFPHSPFSSSTPDIFFVGRNRTTRIKVEFQYPGGNTIGENSYIDDASA
jgi:hypothetical protein